MKKYFNKIPLLIQNKISNSTSAEFEVASIIKLYKTQINSNNFEQIGISLNSQNQISLTTVLPDSSIGRHSKRNVEGYQEVLKSEPKILRTYNLGERPVFGDWSKGSFELHASRKVYRRIQHPTESFTISSEIIDIGQDYDGEYIIFKVKINEIFIKKSEDFTERLLHGINVLMESHGKADIFESSANMIDYIASLSVDWEIFPPGTRELDITRIIGDRVKLDQAEKADFADRYDFLKSLNPIRFVKGLGGSGTYFGAIYQEDLVVFENIKYGNAIYVLFENWREVSKLSRTEILSGNYNYLRIVHDSSWKTKLLSALKLNTAA